ncbi:MAG: NTP transferase domain-containing protein [Bifidobacteriaceae bacterium]|jgi:phosphomannomutase/molybdopterin-guanine dinucleotide biosynthesis protein A|nr:NTP transferase domain-containing protein [Bifidobacteriaceae bacterium]
MATIKEPALLALVLAAGPAATGRELLLKRLGEAAVIDHVLATVAQAAPGASITVVAPREDAAVANHLGPGFRYATQGQPLGPAAAVRAGLDGIGHPEAAPGQVEAGPELLVVAGDLPLLRAASLRGLVARHRLKGAEFSRLTLDGQDVGAYIARLKTWTDLLKQHQTNSLTQLSQAVRASGAKVSEYRIVDPDELRDINTPADLARAADIQLKRLFAPQHAIETGQIAFGTGGWRAKIGEGFTIHNVRRLAQALASELIRTDREPLGVVIGGDRRFLSQESAQAAAEVFAGNNIPATLLPGDVPTPLVTFAAPHLGCAYGLVFTASHNPPQWNGLKVFRQDGSLPLAAETDRYQAAANALTREDIVSVDLGAARAAGLAQDRDLTGAYIDAIERIVDVNAIRAHPVRVLVDPMYGTSQLTLGTILTDARCRVDFIHERHNPLFGGRSPAPDAAALTALIDLVRTGPYDLGLATDGDADRIAIVDQDGRFVTTNDLLLLLYHYLHELRGQRGGIVRNTATTHLLDRLAAHFGETARQVPVGFKHITQGMRDDAALLGGESSGGLTIRGHILGKDGIFACALVVEMLARTGRSIAELLDQVYAITGRAYAVESSLPATPEMRLAVPRAVAAAAPAALGGLAVEGLDRADGFKFLLAGGAWGLLRFSGTEPVLRLFAEAPTPEAAESVMADLAALARGR